MVLENVRQTIKCSVGRDALIAPGKNVNIEPRTCKPCVGDDARIVPWTFALLHIINFIQYTLSQSRGAASLTPRNGQNRSLRIVLSFAL